jgi:histidyl-tRNA synthetase
VSIHNNQIASILQKHMALYGYSLIDLPLIEPADLFLIKAGDPIINSLFTFERHNHQLALRPEFTAGAAFLYTRLYSSQSPVARWQYHGPVFQDPPGNGSSNYQHYSIGAELIGMAGAIADAEIISMAAHGLAALGLAEFQLTIGHSGLTRRVLSRFQLDSRIERFLLHHSATLQTSDTGKTQLLAQLKQLYGPERAGNTTDETLHVYLDETTELIGGRSRQDIARRLGQKRKGAAAWEQITAAADFLEQWGQISGVPDQVWEHIHARISTDDESSRQILTEFQAVIRLLETCGIPSGQIQIRPSLARSWEYYTGIVFELQSGDGLNIGGGGRYNELIQLISQHLPTPAVGFAYHMDNLTATLGQQFDEANTPIQLSANHPSPQVLIQWAHLLRQRAVAVTITDTVETAAQLWVDDAGNCHTQQRAYTPDEIEQLVADLKEMQS